MGRKLQTSKGVVRVEGDSSPPQSPARQPGAFLAAAAWVGQICILGAKNSGQHNT